VGLVRYARPVGCGWHHDEQPGAEAFGPILLPVGDRADLDAALTAHAGERAEVYRAWRRRLPSTGRRHTRAPDEWTWAVSARGYLGRVIFRVACWLTREGLRPLPLVPG
jgi:hypothetical protein